LAGYPPLCQSRLARLEGDVPALFIDYQIAMLNRTLSIFLLVLLTTAAKAQQQSDRFLSDVFGIKTFKMNSTLQDIQNNKEIAGNLSFSYKIDNEVIYLLADQQVNLPGLKPIEGLELNKLGLIFENNKLHDVDLNIPVRFMEQVFKKTCDQFSAKYGHFVIVDKKNSNYKKYAWNLGTNELVLETYPKALVIHYASKISDKKNSWIYADRKGKGDGSIQIGLPYIEKLLKSNLTVASFEKLLPQWETMGVSNHVRYGVNFKNMIDNSPLFEVTYYLNNYDITVQTIDTTSNIISEFTLEKIKDTTVWVRFKKDMDNSGYKIRPKRKYDEGSSYSNGKFMITLDKEYSLIFISKLPFFKF